VVDEHPIKETLFIALLPGGKCPRPGRGCHK
jgi:hypothetical protein